MKTVLLAAVSGAVLSITATGAMAGTSTDISQFLHDAQAALNTIQITGDDTAYTKQTAINAGDLVDLKDASDQSLGDVWQTALTHQIANNWADSWSGTFTNLTQEATNVANSIADVSYAVAIDQSAYGFQKASNEIGEGDSFYFLWDTNALNAAQTATNVSNIASITTLDDYSTQTSDTWQSANNMATYFAPTVPFEGGLAGLTQSATNATNILSIDYLPSASSPFLPEIRQSATGPQLATNLVNVPYIAGTLTQAATNVANSITGITQ